MRCDGIFLLFSIIHMLEISVMEISADECQCGSEEFWSDFIKKDSVIHEQKHMVNNENLLIDVKQGKLRGTTLLSRKNNIIYAYYNIPYAEPPIGDLRFEKPIPPQPWQGIWNATTPGSACMQTDATRTTVSGDEDCLHLNVFTRDISCCLKPVMVFIHGGGWTDGAGRNYQPEFLVDKDVVLVTVNYRLLSFGFLSTQDDVCPGNNGLKDQVAALKWVQDNIASFGGNPNLVTIFGESAGAASVQYHMLSPASQGLFHRAISESGSVFCPWAYMTSSVAIDRAKKLAELLHCPNTDSSNMISCLRDKSAAEVTKASVEVVEWIVQPPLPFRPVIEPKTAKDTFIADGPSNLIYNSISVHTVPWIIGVNSQEGCVVASSLYGRNRIPQLDKQFQYAAPQVLYYGETSQYAEFITREIRDYYFEEESINNNTVVPVVDMFSDGLVFYGVNRAVKMHASVTKAPIFYYYFDYRGSMSNSVVAGDSRRDYGVCHTDELLYLFPPLPGTFNATYTEQDEKMIDYFLFWWTNFAKYGDPTATGDEKWIYVTSVKNTEIAELNDNGIQNHRNLLPLRMEFWESLPLVTTSL